LKKPPASGRTTKHAARRKHAHATRHKHAATAKHHPAAQGTVNRGPGARGGGSGPGVPAPAAVQPLQSLPSKPRKLAALGDLVACCAAESLAASLRLTGARVAEADVLALYAATAGDPDSGQSIVEALRAAQRYSLAGRYPVFEEVMCLAAAERIRSAANDLLSGAGQVILGVDLPGSHAVAVGPDGAWWSWGEPWDPATWPDAVTEEAWWVRWQ